MRKIFLAMAIVIAMLSAGFWHFAATDYSLRQNEQRRKLGAVYMTLNNPFYEVIDEEIRTTVENHGDILISRDPALSVDKQVEEIQELIDNDVELIFINPVDWRTIEPALEIAHAAKIPVIAIDTNVEDDSLVNCTVVSDNYSARRSMRRVSFEKFFGRQDCSAQALASAFFHRQNARLSRQDFCEQKF